MNFNTDDLVFAVSVTSRRERFELVRYNKNWLNIFDILFEIPNSSPGRFEAFDFIHFLESSLCAERRVFFLDLVHVFSLRIYIFCCFLWNDWNPFHSCIQLEKSPESHQLCASAFLIVFLSLVLDLTLKLFHSFRDLTSVLAVSVEPSVYLFREDAGIHFTHNLCQFMDDNTLKSCKANENCCVTKTVTKGGGTVWRMFW